MNAHACIYFTAIVAFHVRKRGLSLCRHREEDIQSEQYPFAAGSTSIRIRTVHRGKGMASILLDLVICKKFDQPIQMVAWPIDL